jgi:ribosome recycling factor
VHNITEILSHKMDEGLKALQKTLSGLRTGRATPALLEPVVVDAYGSKSPLSQVGSISTPEPRLLTVQVWDQSLVSAVDQAIRQALNLSPVIEGAMLKIRIPELTQERRQDLLKTAKNYAEEGRIGMRNLRREALDKVESLNKDKSVSEDEIHILKKEVQKITDKHIEIIDKVLSEKEKEILKV